MAGKDIGKQLVEMREVILRLAEQQAGMVKVIKREQKSPEDRRKEAIKELQLTEFELILLGRNGEPPHGHSPFHRLLTLKKHRGRGTDRGPQNSPSEVTLSQLHHCKHCE